MGKSQHPIIQYQLLSTLKSFTRMQQQVCEPETGKAPHLEKLLQLLKKKQDYKDIQAWLRAMFVFFKPSLDHKADK